ncbi:MAG: hypothetical protein GY943_14615 [Chloroflexi bacterium]|nr:hypothetical protein [Chloroflexota bacterium]
MLATVISKNNIPVRLTVERWSHIEEEHGELADLQPQILKTVANPTRILAGNEGALIAAKELEPGKWLVVVYRETNGDGFIITAFLTRRTRSLEKRTQLWP